MKEIFILLLGLCPLFVQAQETPQQQTEKPLQVIAPQTVSFMGRTFYFSFWDVISNSSHTITNPILKLLPSLKYAPNTKQIPIIDVSYCTKQGVTPDTGLGPADELLSFSTHIHKPTPGWQAITCSGNIVEYNVIKGIDHISIVLAKHTPEGTIVFSGLLEQNPKKSTQVKTTRFETDFGTFTTERKTATLDTKGMDKKARKYAQAMCQIPFPQWLKDVPTIEEIQNQGAVQKSQPKATTVDKPTIFQKNPVNETPINKLQTVQPAFRSRK